ncbi:hypothetical protein NUM_10230 [Actinocatenispora comari]|uniref:Uncharacterized protein n=1 Tax=Actinocatenispora comari TaxID=2807577 RepID=A0A8J4A6B4_9ACTN|nr:hypothetical protein NUM_10230 [Actinocatenispora comari]
MPLGEQHRESQPDDRRFALDDPLDVADDGLGGLPKLLRGHRRTELVESVLGGHRPPPCPPHAFAARTRPGAVTDAYRPVTVCASQPGDGGLPECILSGYTGTAGGPADHLSTTLPSPFAIVVPTIPFAVPVASVPFAILASAPRPRYRRSSEMCWPLRAGGNRVPGRGAGEVDCPT